MVQSFTAGELAERIKRPGEPERVTTDRIRNWTREGLLTTVGAKNPGTGRSRLYARAAIVEAVFLQLFVDCLGVAISQARPILGLAKKRFAETIKAGEIRGSVMLISRSIGKDNFFLGIGPGAKLTELLVEAGPHDTHTIIDFDQLIPRLHLGEK